MTEIESIMVTGEDFSRFLKNLTKVLQSLPDDPRIRLRAITKDYFIRYGFDGTYALLNKKTVSQIFAEYQTAEIRTIAAGEVEGVRYELYESRADRIEISDQAVEDGIS